MGGCYIARTVPGTTPAEALEALRAWFREDGWTDQPADGYGHVQNWPDPFAKGVVRVWRDRVADCAVDWMRGWIAQNPPAGVDPDDKWGPWMAFPLETGGWHFFGWVNT